MTKILVKDVVDIKGELLDNLVRRDTEKWERWNTFWKKHRNRPWEELNLTQRDMCEHLKKRVEASYLNARGRFNEML